MEKVFLREGTPENEVRRLIQEDALNIFFSKERLTFVGTVVSKQRTIYCYPKYFGQINENSSTIESDKKRIVEHMNILNRVFRKLSNQNRNIEDVICNFNPSQLAGTSKKVDRYSLSKYIVDDYFRNGLFTISNMFEGSNISGKIKWGKTVSKIAPAINRNSIVYFKQIKQKWISEPDSIISTLQENIVYDCIQEQQCFGNYLTAKAHKPSIVVDNYSTFVPAIRTMLNQVYSDRDVFLLRALLTWCQECQSQHFISMGGTTAFENVWEWVNDAVFGNQANKSSSSPLYNLFGLKFRGKGESKPDTLFIDISDTEIKINIYDAKYYVPKSITAFASPNEGEINGFPANSDISKQIAYRYYINRYCDALNSSLTNPKKITLTNTFLVPSFNAEIIQIIQNVTSTCSCCSTLTRYIGEVSVGEFDLLLSVFNVPQGNWTAIQQQYFSNNDLKVNVCEVNTDLLYLEYLKQ